MFICQLLPRQGTGTAISLRYLHRCAQCFGVSFWRHNFHGVHSNLGSLGSLFCFAACRCIYRLKFLRRISGTRHAGALRISLCGLLCWGCSLGVAKEPRVYGSRYKVLRIRTSGHKERGGPHTQRPTPHVPGTVFGAASHRYPEFHGRCRRDEESSTTYMVPVGTFFSTLPARSFRFWCPAERDGWEETKAYVSRRA